MTGPPLLLSRFRSASYWPDVSTKNLHLRPTLIVDDPVPKFLQTRNLGWTGGR
jgi:hypothetical protein